MTQDQFTAFAAAVLRHLLTLAAGVLVARGYIGASDAVSNYAAAIAVFGAALAWSFVQKHNLLKKLCEGLNVSALEQLLAQAAALKKQGADPLLVAHMTGTALAIAQGELASVRPDLVPVAAPPVSPPAEAVPAPPTDQPPVAMAEEPGSALPQNALSTNAFGQNAGADE